MPQDSNHKQKMKPVLSAAKIGIKTPNPKPQTPIPPLHRPIAAEHALQVTDVGILIIPSLPELGAS